ncbi:MAG: type I-B CRISPR-associated protein Cas7/Cst2/DevR [Hydrotalea sp. AMD]|uniref:type I-B CRISPR-associated protein Cas7/Cst2/DevR n=1 Tax=Hydrotalea sp. AMD TaxID=2501297 RepID=UPI0009450C3D|nr:type I-B CRISPR-associated protein Cas7/Cst2/DevR [Hydrotalea sp. AMD]RWZ90752.1 MAG: type I-B CRISPR-associated protein Cas7/Cst2/DevR [Hydrotalea sp. AMD]
MNVQGLILIDVNGVALNNAGTTQQAGIENKTVTKKISKNGLIYTYVSGQAWRYWWREALQKEFNWNMSPIIKVDGKSQVYTAANPIQYDDDDIFGYMRAEKETEKDEKGETKKNKNGKDKEKDVTVTRVSPLKNSVIISVASTRPVSHFSSASRQNDVPVPYGKDEYSAIMKGMFSLDLEQAGTFASYNKTGFKNINEKLFNEAKELKGASILQDKYVKDKKGEFEQLIRLPIEIRRKRVIETLSALKFINGGAMQTNNMDDVTPKFIVLATFKTGNHPFSHIAKPDSINENNVQININGIKEILKDYKDQFIGDVFIGKRSGFLDEFSGELEELKSLGDEYPKVQVASINETIDNYCEQLKQQLV